MPSVGVTRGFPRSKPNTMSHPPSARTASNFKQWKHEPGAIPAAALMLSSSNDHALLLAESIGEWICPETSEILDSLARHRSPEVCLAIASRTESWYSKVHFPDEAVDSLVHHSNIDVAVQAAKSASVWGALHCRRFALLRYLATCARHEKLRLALASTLPTWLRRGKKEIEAGRVFQLLLEHSSEDLRVELGRNLPSPEVAPECIAETVRKIFGNSQRVKAESARQVSFL